MDHDHVFDNIDLEAAFAAPTHGSIDTDGQIPIEVSALTHHQKLVRTTFLRHSSKLAYGYLSFDVLHRLVLLHHQHELTNHVQELVRTKDCSEAMISSIRRDLHQYRESMEDYMFWRQKKQTFLYSAISAVVTGFGFRDQQKVIPIPDISAPHSEFIPALKELLDDFPLFAEPQPVWTHSKRRHVRFASAVGIPRFLSFRFAGGSWSRDGEFVQSRNRLIVAIIGGLALVVPMLIMTLHQDTTTSLVTVSIAVLLFACALAIWPLVYGHLPWVKRWESIGGENELDSLGAKEILLSTAAYAAVLVVFVGTSIS